MASLKVPFIKIKDPLKLPQMNAYAKHFDKNNKYINLLVNDKEILKKYSEI